MTEFFFLSYSSVEAKEFALTLTDELAAGPPSIALWLDQRTLRPGEDWDDQIGEAIKTCKGLIFVMSPDSVRPDSVCKNEWVRALKYKKPVIPLLLNRDADLPLRLGSREYIDFVGPLASAMARLRKHLTWMDSAEGKLQALKHRFSDAQRELPRAAPDQQARIRDDIADLERQIAQQQRVLDNPKEAEQRVQQSIQAGLEGERQPATPVGGIPTGKFINPPPLIAPTWFQDRHVETQQIGDFLKDESLRLLTIVGRGGVGKTAMTCRLLRALEGGHLPDEGGALKLDGIVYLSAARSFHRPNVPDMYAGLTKLLPDEMATSLDALYKNPQSTTRATLEALTQAFPRGRTVVLLDNFEDLLAVETGRINDADLDEALRALLEVPPHALKIIITTRVAPSELAAVQPGLQRRLDLDAGLGPPFAENILKSMDADGKVKLRDASDALLASARERTLGYPRALEHLFGILSADRDTSLQDILDDTRKFLPEQVVVVLVGEAFCRLDINAQRVMQALATYRYPVPPAAVDYLLQPYVPGIDSGRVLSRLVNMRFAQRDAGRYYLHQVDRDYALSRLAEGNPGDRDAAVPPLTRIALRHRAAEWFKLSRKPREDWKTLGDLAAQLSEFELRCEGEDYDTAAALLVDFDYDYLFLWGHYRLMAELHERLQGKIADQELAQNSAGSLGAAYLRTGQTQRGVTLYEQNLTLARQRSDRWGEETWLCCLAAGVSGLGQNARAIEYVERALAIAREIGDRKGEADALTNLSSLYSEIGQFTQAVKYVEEALLIDRELKDQVNEALDLNNLGDYFRVLGRPDKALECHSEALTTARTIGYRFIEASARVDLGKLRVYHEDWDAVVPELERAIDIADEIGSARHSKEARETLALVHIHRNNLGAARDLTEAARKYDIALSNPSTSAMLGVVALRQRDLSTARAAFTAAINEASSLLALTANRYDALDTQGLSLCGLALSGDPAQIPSALAAYRAARAITSDVGITRAVVQRLDALSPADPGGLLAQVRPVAAGIQAASDPPVT